MARYYINVIQNAITVPTGFISKYCKYENDTFGTESEIIPTDPGLYKVILYKDDTAIGSHLFKILENGTDKDYTIAYYKKIGTDAESGDPVWSTGSVTVTDAGVYKAVISFKAKPNESITKEFEITPKAINVIAAGISKIYGDADPILLYTFDENSLLGTDGFRGNLSRVSGENTGEYDIEQNTLSAGGNYTINFTGAKFTINPKPLGSDAVRLSVGELDYNGTTVAPEVTVYDGESEVPASEYTVRFSNNVNVGTATVEVLDVNGGNYTVSGEKTYNIKKANVTVTALPQTVKQDSAISTGTELAVLTGAASGHYLSSVTLNSTSTSVADTTGTITASSAVIKDATGNDVTANYDITYNTGILTVIGKQSKIVTFKVENGAWDDGTTADKVVILNGYEGDSLKLAAKDIPAVGNKADKNFKEGSWKASTAVSTANISDTPEADKVIPADTVYTYTYAEKDRISATVSFKVVNGAWDDGTTADKVVILNGYEGDSLKLAAKDIPAVGNKPNENYKAGSWDAVPDVNKEFSNSESVVYTYTYAKDDTSSSKEEETTEEPEESSSSSSYSRNYYAYNIGTQPKTTNTNDGSNKNIKKVNNPDGSVTTITTIKNLDNSVTTVTETVDKDGNVTKVTETVKKYPSGGVKTNTKTEYPDGKVITNKKTEYSNGNVYSKTVEKDKNGNTVTTTTENTVIGSKGTKTFTSRTVNADGSHSKTYIKETASGKKTEKKYRFDAEGNGTYSEEKSNKNGVTYSQSFDITGTNAVLTAFFTTKKKVTIPKSILVAGIERLITAIAKGAFEGNITITNIKVEAGITTIGSKAFAGALNLKKLFLPSTIIKIGKNAFSGLLKLTIYISAKDKKAYDEAAEKLKKLLKKAGVDLSLITIKRDK